MARSNQEEQPRDLEGRVAIVTGSSRGIGKAIALHLAKRGAKVAVNYVSNKEEGEKVLQEIGADRGVLVQADMSSKHDVVRLFDETETKLGKIDILVNGAAYMDDTYAKIADVTDEVIDKTIDINLKGVIYALREAGRRVQDGGRIVNITTSLVVFHNTGYGVATYAASKAAVELLTKNMAHELRGRHITINSVAPGPTATDMFYRGKTEEMVSRVAKMNPLERIGQPGDIANVVGFLCSPAAEWVNGQIVRANGGYV